MFDPTQITDIFVQPDGAEALVTWTSTAVAGSWFQVYVDRKFVTYTQELRATISSPPSGVDAQIVVGVVDDGEQTTDFSSSIAGLANIVKLAWLGGSWESPNISGFHVYGSPVNGSINYSTVLATIVAYPQGISQDGWGLGGWGLGGWGQASTRYSWTSGRLASGTWHFGVKPYDTAGNEGTAQETTVVIIGPPNPPARNAQAKRLTYNAYAISGGHATAVLNWLASP